MRNLVITITLLMTVMLFLNNPLDENNRLLQSIWNLGHLFFFAFLTWLLLTHTTLQKQGWLKMLLVSVLLSIVLGGLIEVLQSFIGRYMEWQDVVMDILGGLMGFLVVQFSMPADKSIIRRPVASLLLFVVAGAALYPVFNIVRDDYKIRSDFPLIAGFESESNLLRWDYSQIERFELDSQLSHKPGASSLYVKFAPGEYPTISLIALYSDWSRYRYLNLSLHNDQLDELEINLKVYDSEHRVNGPKYTDRFNLEVMLKPGWNQLKISLLDIYNAPHNRKMDLRNIAGLSLFLTNVKQSQSIHLDNIYLSN